MSINRVVITGNLTRDAELRQTAGGTAVLGLGVAVNDRRRNPQTGEWEDVPNFIEATLFGARAEGLARYLVKGTKVAIEGKLRYSQWEKDGQKRSKLEVVVDEIEFMSSRQQQYQQQPQPQQYQQQYAPQQYAQPQQMNMYAPPGGQQPDWSQQAAEAVRAAGQQGRQMAMEDADIPF